MFHTLASLSPALESAETDRAAQKHAFLVSRLERRWNYNKDAPSKARTLVKRLQVSISAIKKSTRNRRFDEKKFSSLIERKQYIDAKLMLAGLSEIPKLAAVFQEIASQPPSQESGNLPKFKTLMKNSLKKHTPAYSYASYQVYAAFMGEKTMLKKNGSLSATGYTEDFINTVEKTLQSMDVFIQGMEDHVELMDKLASNIVDVLMGKEAVKYQHARRQYELVCSSYRSMLITAPFQYLNLAISTANTIARCYD